MNNKKNAVIITLFIAAVFIIIAILGIAEHIPFIGKIFAFIIAISLTAFIVLFFVIIERRK